MLVWIVLAAVLSALFMLTLLYLTLVVSANFNENELRITIIPVFPRWKKEYFLHRPWQQVGKFWSQPQPSDEKEGSPGKRWKPPGGVLSYLTLAKTISRKLVVKNLQWETHLGAGDAAYTAIFTGGLWAFKGSVIGFLSSLAHLQEIHIQVIPDYSLRANLSTRLYCIFQMRIANIILVAIYIFVWIVRGFWYGYRTKQAEPSH